MTQQGWPERLAAQVAVELRRHRARRGYSAQQLADECAKLGMPIQRSVIANFENGRRANVSVAELLVFAAALRISPLELAFPVGYERLAEGLPGRSDETYNWAAWFSGEESGFDFSSEEINAMDIVRALLPEFADLMRSKGKLTEAEASLDQVRPDVEALEARIAEAEHQMDVILERREANIADREAATDLLSEEYKGLADEGKRLAAMHREALERLQSARAAGEELLAKRASVERWREHVAEDERAVREVIAEFDKHGFVTPDLPDEWAYLLEPEAKKIPAEGRRGRGKPRTRRG
ncbi:helix-turn-helix domain-containing protein [Streptomyces sp. NPDC102259]|uniref:helix-turn-helix domain-containing protein n=1 Tax=Streptomyces sp. NPDC102259 TaxID=3366148 RepID=UPI0038231CD3